MPVREALIQLESEGLVDNIARHGSFVAMLDPEDRYDPSRPPAQPSADH